MGDEKPLTLDIPLFLKRDANNRAEFMSVEVDEATESRPAKTKTKAVKANGHDKAPVKAKGKPEVKAAPKAPKVVKTAPKAPAKAAKAPKPAKVAKAATAEKDAYGFRKGSAKSKAVAMFARKNGATLEEIKEAIGSVQLNALVALEEDGHTVERKKETREGARSVTRYILKPKK